MPQFHNPIAPRIKSTKSKNIWDFKCPVYDERTSCYTNTGSHYGVGFTNPVGHSSGVKQRVATLPYGHKLGMQTDEAPRRILGQDMVE